MVDYALDEEELQEHALELTKYLQAVDERAYLATSAVHEENEDESSPKKFTSKHRSSAEIETEKEVKRDENPSVKRFKKKRP